MNSTSSSPSRSCLKEAVAERWPSQAEGERLLSACSGENRYPGFESRPLRHKKPGRPRAGLFFAAVMRTVAIDVLIGPAAAALTSVYASARYAL